MIAAVLNQVYFPFLGKKLIILERRYTESKIGIEVKMKSTITKRGIIENKVLQDKEEA